MKSTVTQFALIATQIERFNRSALLISLNGFALVIFFFIGFRYNYLHPDNMGRLMFATPDTKQYREIADWINGKTVDVPVSTRLRPMLYPSLLASVRRVTENPYVFWAVQFSLWLISINLVTFATYQFTKRNFLLIVAFCIMTLNVSAIVITYYALTETLTIFLWAVWLFVFAQTNRSNPQSGKLFLLTLLLSLLTITKPIFLIHLVLFVGCLLFKHIRNLKRGTIVASAIIPVVIQILINLNLNGLFGVSDISMFTVKWYLLPQVFASRNAIPLDDARRAVADYDTIRTMAYLLQNGASSLSFYLQNSWENITAASDYIDYYPKPYIFTRITNVVYLIVQIAWLPAIISLFRNKTDSFALPIKLLYIFSLFIILTSGISFNEGDRLVMTALPLWVVIYTSMPVIFFNLPNANRSIN